MTATIVLTAGERGDDRFNRLAAGFVGVTLLLSVLIPLIPLPEPDRAEIEKLPPRLAEIILEKRRAPPPPPVPEPEPEPEVEEPVTQEEPEPQEIVEAPREQTVKEARENASFAGVLAFRDQLAGLRDVVDTSSLAETGAIQQGSGEAAQLDRSLLTADSGERTASVNAAALSRDVGGVALAGRETTRVEAPEVEAAQTGARRLQQVNLDAARSIEDIRRVFDANKGAIYAIYNRALRRDPSLYGKVVLELVIEPDGRVSACDIVSSELPDEDMMAKIIRRVQLFNFGEKNVGVTKINYPVHFLPT